MRTFYNFAIVMLLASCAYAQRADDFALQTKHANVICSAVVTAIEPPTSSRNTYLIRVKVEDALRGAQSSEEIVIAEWAGRWELGQPRYRVGERYVLFLSISKGTASVVTGESGRLRVEKDDNVTLPSRTSRAQRLRGEHKSTRVPYADALRAIRSAMRERE